MAEAQKTGGDDLFSPKNKQSNSNFVDWKEIGQRVVGTLVARDIRPNRLQPGTYQEVYTLVLDDGQIVQIAGRMSVDMEGKKVKIIGRLHQVPIGLHCGVEYNRDEDTGQPQPAKILEVYDKGEIFKEVLEKYQGVAAAGPASDKKAESPEF